jgi:hypothetical protein
MLKSNQGNLSSHSLSSSNTNASTKSKTNFIEKNKNLVSKSSKINAAANQNEIIIKCLNEIDDQKIITLSSKTTISIEQQQYGKHFQSDKENQKDEEISIISDHSSILSETNRKKRQSNSSKTSLNDREIPIEIQSVQNQENDKKYESILRTSQNCDTLRNMLFNDNDNIDNTNNRAFTPPVSEKSPKDPHNSFHLEFEPHLNENDYLLDFVSNKKESYLNNQGSCDDYRHSIEFNDTELNILKQDANKSKIRSEFIQK